jgi:hypothetical protein
MVPPSPQVAVMQLNRRVQALEGRMRQVEHSIDRLVAVLARTGLVGLVENRLEARVRVDTITSIDATLYPEVQPFSDNGFYIQGVHFPPRTGSNDAGSSAGPSGPSA